LLSALLVAVQDNCQAVALLDSRMTLPVNRSVNLAIKFVEPSIWQRFMAEWWLVQQVALEDIVLCFGNLPPLFKLRGRTVVFVQNRYLIDDVKLNEFPLRVRLRLVMERLWLSRKMTNADEFVVQTPTMKRLLEMKTEGKIPVRILPFMQELKECEHSMSQPKVQKDNNYDSAIAPCIALPPASMQSFVYVASGEPHKNHRRLIEAWCLLAEEGLFPSLCLTLNEARFATLCREIEVMRQRYGLKVTNAGEMSHKDALALYKKACALIYPSAFESFGLPLVEAREAGLPVLAAELDYVRDIVVPEQSFDPDSPVSIARAVKRYLGVVETPLKILDAISFLDLLMNRRS